MGLHRRHGPRGPPRAVVCAALRGARPHLGGHDRPGDPGLGRSGRATRSGTTSDRRRCRSWSRRRPGIGSGHASIGDQPLVREVLGLPEGREPAMLVALGYPAERPLTPVDRPSRRPFDDVVHVDRRRHCLAPRSGRGGRRFARVATDFRPRESRQLRPTISRTSSAYRSSLAGPTPEIAARSVRSPGFRSAISASVRSWNTT